MEEQIRQRAYELWEADGRPHGADQTYWFRAVAELASRTAARKKPAGRRAASSRGRKAA